MASTLRSVGFTLSAVTAALLLPALTGCPNAPGSNLDASSSALLGIKANFDTGTVGKQYDLVGSASGGTPPYRYGWTQTSGPPVALNASDQAAASFVPSVAGIYHFELSVSDSAARARTSTATYEVTVGDVMFVVADDNSGFIKPGNPAVVQVNQLSAAGRADYVRFEAQARIMDPKYYNDNETRVQLSYELVSVPSGGRNEDVSFDRVFDTISNQGTGDFNSSDDSSPTLDASVGITIRANPDSSYQTLSNLATLVQNFGGLVSGNYVFRCTSTDADGVRRTRDLTVTLVTEGIDGLFGGRTGGPKTIAAKTLPNGAPGQVTDFVMTSNQTTSVVVTVFPASATTYRFYLRDNNPIVGLGSTTPTSFVAFPQYVSASTTTAITASGAPTDVSLTIGAAGGMAVGTYDLFCESFDSLGNVWETPVLVNGTTLAAGGKPLRFHVTRDFFLDSSINAATVGNTSNNVDQPVLYQGWSGTPTGGHYGQWNAAADVNGDGVLDLISAVGADIRVNTQGYVAGSASALRHPTNAGNFVANLPNSTQHVINVGGPIQQLVAGDLRGSGRPDLAVSYQAAGVGYVKVYFHTGNPAWPYSDAAEHTLVIAPPEYQRKYQNQFGQISANPFGPVLGPSQTAGNLLPSRALFGTRLAIANVSGDATVDLIVSDPGYSRLTQYNFITSGGPTPNTLDAYFEGQEGRVYVFNGGSAGVLRPGRPLINASRISETAAINSGAALGQQAGAVTTSETEVQFTQHYFGQLFDRIGQSLAAGVTLSSGSPQAIGDPAVAATPVLRLHIPDYDAIGASYVFANNDEFTMNLGGRTVIYRFWTGVDPTNLAAIPPVIGVNISGAAPNNQRPEAARAALLAAFNSTGSIVSATLADPTAYPNTLLVRGVAAMTYKDTVARGGLSTATIVASVGVAPTNAQNLAANGVGTLIGVNGQFDVFCDGVVYGQPAASGQFLNAQAVRGLANSNMGLGATLARGNLDNNGVNNDLLIGARHSGNVRGRSTNGVLRTWTGGIDPTFDDGAVIACLNDATAFTWTSSAGANTLNAPADVRPAGLGRDLAIGNVNGDSFGEAFYTEPGFGRIHMHNGAALTASPNLAFSGLVLDQNISNAGSFLFGNWTGNPGASWMFLNGSAVFGLNGFAR